MLNLSSEQMQRYIISAQLREKERLTALQKRRQKGLEMAYKAASILKNEFAVKKVILFGSLLRDDFHEESDIDLGVIGLPEKQYFQAVSRLLSLGDFAFDLVEFQYASPEIVKAITAGMIL